MFDTYSFNVIKHPKCEWRLYLTAYLSDDVIVIGIDYKLLVYKELAPNNYTLIQTIPIKGGANSYLIDNNHLIIGCYDRHMHIFKIDNQKPTQYLTQI